MPNIVIDEHPDDAEVEEERCDTLMDAVDGHGEGEEKLAKKMLAGAR